MRLKYILFFLASVFFSCNKKNPLVDNLYGIQEILISEEIEIPIDDVYLNSYLIHSSYSFQGDDYIITYNYLTHSLDKFNVSQQTVSHIKLDLEGPNGIVNDVNGLYLHSADSIWIYAAEIISLIDSVGKVQERIKLHSQKNDFPFIFTNFSTSTSKFYYNSTRNSLFYLTISLSKGKSSFFATEYALLDHSIKTYPLKPTEEKNFRKDYGWKQCPNVTYTDKAILYNFPIESNIYVIDIETNNCSVFGGKSRYTSNSVKKLSTPFSFDDGNRHIFENVHFFELLYDSVNDLYYRLHLSDVEYDAVTDFEEIYHTKTMYLMIFDNQFKIINETKLDEKRYNYRNFWGMLHRGFFIGKNNMFYKDIDYEKLQLDLFNIK